MRRVCQRVAPELVKQLDRMEPVTWKSVRQAVERVVDRLRDAIQHKDQDRSRGFER